MTEFERLYNEKKGTVEDCLKAIHSYSRVCFAGDGNQPNVILSNLHKYYCHSRILADWYHIFSGYFKIILKLV